jgi:hypothetical protein
MPRVISDVHPATLGRVRHVAARFLGGRLQPVQRQGDGRDIGLGPGHPGNGDRRLLDPLA